MPITIGETTTEVTVSAYTTLAVDKVPIEIRGRSGLVTGAQVYWEFEEDAWGIRFIQVTGPFLNKDGRESKQQVDVATHPDDGSGSRSRTITPPEVLTGALAYTPDWTPELSASPYLPRPQKSRAVAVSRQGLPAEAPERVTHVETTSQVVLHAFTVLLPVDYLATIGARTARIKKALARWDYENGEWVLGAVDVWGPVIRQSDGEESAQHVAALTRPAFASNAQYGVITPTELVEVALTAVPEWTPTISPTQYPRSTTVRSNL